MSVNPARVVSTLVPATAQFGAGTGALDLVALADVKSELNITVTTYDGWLAQVISRMSQLAQKFCNRTLVSQTYVENVFGFNDPYPWQVPGRTGPLQLANWPIATIPSPAGTAPPLGPTLSSGGSSSLSARVYYVRLTYVTSNGETAGSPEGRIALAAGTQVTVAAPGDDVAGIATGYNVYASTMAGAETLQNASPISTSASWTEPTSGLVAGAALNSYVLVAENVSAPYATSPAPPLALVEGQDFLVDAENGQIERLDPTGRPRLWNPTPVQVIYPAGYTAATIPDDLQDAVIQLVKARWYSRARDPMLKSQNVVGVLASTWGAAAGGASDIPDSVEDTLERYRVPVVG